MKFSAIPFLAIFIAASLISAQTKPAPNAPADDDLPSTPSADFEPRSPEPMTLATAPSAEVPLDDAWELLEIAGVPQIHAPRDARFDHRGRLFVAEHYPGTSNDRIVILEDLDHDGRYEHAVAFATNLTGIGGIQPWKNGVVVSTAKRILYLADEDDDSQVDREETWAVLTSRNQEVEHAGPPRLGFEGLIYVPAANPKTSANMRVEEKSREFDLAGGGLAIEPRSQKGGLLTGSRAIDYCRDEFGARFSLHASGEFRHVVFETYDLAKNPRYRPAKIENTLIAAGKTPRGAAWIQGTSVPAELTGSLLFMETEAGELHECRFRPWGATFAPTTPISRLLYKSKSNTFRPIGATTGPDGSMYLVNRGSSTGEGGGILRFRAKPSETIEPSGGAHSASMLPASDNAETWIPLLNHRNAWHRETAQRKLSELGHCDRSRLSAAYNDASAEGAIRIAWTFSRLFGGTFREIQNVTHIDDARVREAFARIMEADGDARLAELGELRFRTLFYARYQNRFAPRVGLALAPLRTAEFELNHGVDILAYGEPDPFAHSAAMMTILWNSPTEVLRRWERQYEFLKRYERVTAPNPEFQRNAAGLAFELGKFAARYSSEQDLTRWLNEYGVSEYKAMRPTCRLFLTRALHGMAAGLETPQHSEASRVLNLSPQIAQWSQRASLMLSESEREVSVESYDAFLLFARCDRTAFREKHAEFQSNRREGVRAAAIRAASGYAASEDRRELLARWPNETPAVRREIAESFLPHEEDCLALLAELIDGSARPLDFENDLRARLAKHASPRVAAEAVRLIPEIIDTAPNASAKPAEPSEKR